MVRVRAFVQRDAVAPLHADLRAHLLAPQAQTYCYLFVGRHWHVAYRNRANFVGLQPVAQSNSIAITSTDSEQDKLLTAIHCSLVLVCNHAAADANRTRDLCACLVCRCWFERSAVFQMGLQACPLSKKTIEKGT